MFHPSTKTPLVPKGFLWSLAFHALMRVSFFFCAGELCAVSRRSLRHWWELLGWQVGGLGRTEGQMPTSSRGFRQSWSCCLFLESIFQGIRLQQHQFHWAFWRQSFVAWDSPKWSSLPASFSSGLSGGLQGEGWGICMGVATAAVFFSCHCSQVSVQNASKLHISCWERDSCFLTDRACAVHVVLLLPAVPVPGCWARSDLVFSWHMTFSKYLAHNHLQLPRDGKPVQLCSLPLFAPCCFLCAVCWCVRRVGLNRCTCIPE